MHDGMFVWTKQVELQSTDPLQTIHRIPTGFDFLSEPKEAIPIKIQKYQNGMTNVMCIIWVNKFNFDDPLTLIQRSPLKASFQSVLENNIATFWCGG